MHDGRSLPDCLGNDLTTLVDQILQATRAMVCKIPCSVIQYSRRFGGLGKVGINEEYLVWGCVVTSLHRKPIHAFGLNASTSLCRTYGHDGILFTPWMTSFMDLILEH